MSELVRLLCSAISARSGDEKAALLCSGGIDSVSVGIAAQKAGKRIQAYTFELQGYRSKDRPKAEAVARHFGWPLRVVTIPTSDVRHDFVRLAVEHRCRKKVHYEVTFPLTYVLPEIEETEVWTGWNADDHYGNERKIILEQARMIREGISRAERKQHFDRWRGARFEGLKNPNSADTWWCAQRLAAKHDKRLFDPYVDDLVRDYFLAFDHEQLSPLKKPLVRKALTEELRGLFDSNIAVGVQLQIGGGVDALFRTLLADPTINRFDRLYSSVSPLCQRWAKEVAADPSRFEAELADLPPRRAAAIRTARSERYRPYTMRDVQEASALRRFTVISTFSGGGGSSIGYRLAGGVVLMAGEFVPEAARTYRTNFPECPVDQRDIRQITENEGGVEAFLAAAGLKVGELDVLDGSPPCCEFSVAGRGISDQNVLRPYSDVRQKNIATLLFDFVELAARALPKVVVCENVPALATRGREIFERVMRALRSPGRESPGRVYYVSSSVLTASEFGVPQKRRRLFIIGVRRDVGDAVGIASDESVLGLFPAPTHACVTVRAALVGLQQSAADVHPWHRSARVTSLGAAIRRLPRSPEKLTRLCHVDPDDASRFTLARCSWGLPAPTLVVTGQRPDGMTGAIHPDDDRKFTIPELKRLFALPDDFTLTGTLGQAAERICRMVPPPLTKAIAESVHQRVLQPYQEKMK